MSFKSIVFLFLCFFSTLLISEPDREKKKRALSFLRYGLKGAGFAGGAWLWHQSLVYSQHSLLPIPYAVGAVGLVGCMLGASYYKTMSLREAEEELEEAKADQACFDENQYNVDNAGNYIVRQIVLTSRAKASGDLNDQEYREFERLVATGDANQFRTFPNAIARMRANERVKQSEQAVEDAMQSISPAWRESYGISKSVVAGGGFAIFRLCII